jgi:phosphatidate cytidylyltransferase
MPEADPARPVDTVRRPGTGELALRVLSALLLAPIAVFVAYWGGWAFAVFWGIAAILVAWEWTGLVLFSGSRDAPASDCRVTRAVVVASVLVAAACAGATGQMSGGWHAPLVLAAFAALAIGMFAGAALAPRAHGLWVACGVPYAGMIALAPVLLRADAGFGLVAIVFLFAVVWATDILAYFVGRAVGGPKVAPRISPKKTWSGAFGGTAAAVAGAIAIAWWSGLGAGGKIALLAALLSVVAQAGDFFESAVKRRFGAKDSGHLIPGHGGLMDRLDGFVTAAAAALLVGIARGGLDEPARGLLVW